MFDACFGSWIPFFPYSLLLFDFFHFFSNFVFLFVIFPFGAALIGTMPVGGVQSQNPTQGLVHWMSAVMAEHMTSNSHHDPTVGMHYMWNGGVDVSFIFLQIVFIYESVMRRKKQLAIHKRSGKNPEWRRERGKMMHFPKITFKYRMFDITFPLIQWTIWNSMSFAFSRHINAFTMLYGIRLLLIALMKSVKVDSVLFELRHKHMHRKKNIEAQNEL